MTSRRPLMIGRHVAPAGAPIALSDLKRWLSRPASGADAGAELRQAICAHLGRSHCQLTSTGRAGLTVLLSAFRSLVPPERDEVVLPSYTCYSVAASVVRAGLRLRIVDVDPSSIDFDLEKLGNEDFRRVLAVVVTNLYGLPGRLPEISRIARDNNVFLIDDAAQSLGARVGGRPSGAWGDAGLLSFDKGKAVSAIDGGAVVTDSDAVAREIEVRLRGSGRPGLLTTCAQALKVGAYVAFLRPEWYWIVNALPGLGLGRTEYRTDFPLRAASPWLAALAATMWPRLTDFCVRRVANARRYLEGISRISAFTPVRPVAGAEPTYLRLPLVAADEDLQRRLIGELNGAGIGASGSYPGAISDIAAVRPHLAGRPDATAGRSVAGRIVTLPTHPYVSPRDIDRALGVLVACSPRVAVDGVMSGTAK